jgi:hypothetical protein
MISIASNSGGLTFCPVTATRRMMSRRVAINSISKRERDDYLKERGVTLLGGGMDEAPQAYKPIEQVIAAQQDLVDVLGKFTPRIVRMADEPGDILISKMLHRGLPLQDASRRPRWRKSYKMVTENNLLDPSAIIHK